MQVTLGLWPRSRLFIVPHCSLSPEGRSLKWELGRRQNWLVFFFNPVRRACKGTEGGNGVVPASERRMEKGFL